MSVQVSDLTPWDVFDKNTLAGTLTRAERNFGKHYGMETVLVDEPGPENFYHFLDRGASVLAVAHLDTVVSPRNRRARFYESKDGLVVNSGALDDRLGAYVILEMLPKLGIVTDVLLTVGEESGRSTAAHFEAPRQYDHIIEFDRGGMDVVLYQYHDDETVDRVERSGAVVGLGAFSDTAFLEHLGCKGINWGVGYHDYHSTRGYAYLDDTFDMVNLYRRFHAQNEGVFLEHVPKIRETYVADGDDEENSCDWDAEAAREWRSRTDPVDWDAFYEDEYERFLEWDHSNDNPTPAEIERATAAWGGGWDSVD